VSALNRRQFVSRLLPCVAVLVLVVIIAPGVGSHDVGLGAAWRSLLDDSNTVAHTIAWDLRFPRTIKALIAGITLALSGAVFQTLFRNPLATPYTMGIASGASLGALIAYKISWVTSYAGISSVALSAFIAALLVLALVLLLARVATRITGQTLLLAGVTIGFFCSGMMIFVTSLADVSQTHRTVRWMMGNLDTFGGVELTALLPIVAPAWIVLLLLARGLNQYELGSDLAATRGVNVLRLELIGIIAASLAVAAVVSVCGPIGFVGLIIPHLTRILLGRDHRILLPAAALLGATFLIICDFLTTLLPSWYGALAGSATTTARLPIGVMTALIGTPVFLLLLCTRRK
jgi:iron complex transport system permease protein